MSRHLRGPRPKKAIPWAVAAMPAYTVGFLAPVPFLYAALRLRTRTLWTIVSGYVAFWVAAWILTAGTSEDSLASTVGVVLFFALAAGGATHAFVLRQTLSRNSGTQLVVAELPRAERPMDLEAALSLLTSNVAAHAASLPTNCKQLFDETVAQMEQVIRFVASNGHADAELRSIEMMLTDYLPTSIDTYLRLPREFALSQRNPDGRTAAEELELQLRLLRDSAKEATDSLYRGDALRLEEQSAFLQSKFGRSELDLG